MTYNFINQYRSTCAGYSILFEYRGTSALEKKKGIAIRIPNKMKWSNDWNMTEYSWMQKIAWIIHWVVVSNIFYFYPYLVKWSNLTNIFQMGWNHQLVQYWGLLWEQLCTKMHAESLSFALWSTVTRCGPFVGCCHCSYKGTKGLTTRFWNYFRRKAPTGVKDKNKESTAKKRQWYLFVEPNKRDLWRCGCEVTQDLCAYRLNIVNKAYGSLKPP